MYKGLGFHKKQEETSFDGSKPIKATPQVGDVFPNVNTLKEFINEAFYPFVGAKLNLNSIGAPMYCEIGTSPTVTITASTTANDETEFLSPIKVLENNIEVGEIGGIAGSLVLENRSGSIKRYKLQMQVGNDGTQEEITSNIKVLYFIYPYFYGKNTTGVLPTEAQITASTKVVALANNAITINPNTANNEYGFIVVEQLQSKNFSKWKVTELNQGSIGVGQFIEKKGTALVNGRTYDVYQYNYASELKTNITLS